MLEVWGIAGNMSADQWSKSDLFSPSSFQSESPRSEDLACVVTQPVHQSVCWDYWQCLSVLGKNHFTLLAQPCEKRLPLLILEDCVQLFWRLLFGGETACGLFMCSGSILAIEYIDGRSKRKKCDVDSLESLSYLLKCIQFNLARELRIIPFKERLNFEK